ncbi:putative neck passage structure protein [Lactococcus phage CB14a]|uniref:Putative neck passage structure protein n=3 Tax=Skunavirus CB14 TaxID=665884 RepID=A0A2H4PRW3_9CAUD|nr:neck passage structure protein [Lactococcus phage CB14]ACU46880.1 putative neck passage structure protein [Lactococcus phage CB14]ATW70016.1 putative neck passage structure protein [Lactococcus phage CB14a]ATW70041.1 putative neck passage structure protein [Lactococcus phage CB14b]
MSLDNFRNRTIIWDTVNKDFPQPIQIMQGDVNARTLLIKIVDNGVEIDLTGHSLKLTYQYTNSSNSGFVMIPPENLTKGEFILVIPTEMTETGVIEANLILLNEDKEQVIVSKNLTFISDNSTVTDLAQEVNNKIDDFTKLLLENMPQVMRSELNDLHAQTESNKSNIELKANLSDMTSLQSAMTELKNEVEAFGISPENLVTIKSLLDAIASNASESEVAELINSVKSEIYEKIKILDEQIPINKFKDGQKDFSLYTSPSENSLYVINKPLSSGSIIAHVSSNKDQAASILIVKKTDLTFTILSKKNINLTAGNNTVDMDYTVSGDGTEYLATVGVINFKPNSRLGFYQIAYGSNVGNVGDTFETVDHTDIAIDLGVYAEYKGQLEINYDDLLNRIEKCNSLLSLPSLTNFLLPRYTQITEPVGFVGRWFDSTISGTNVKSTINQGSELYFKVKNTTSINVNFIVNTAYKTPYFAYSIDGADMTRQLVTSPTLPTVSLDEHIIRVVVDGVTESENKWIGEKGFAFKDITVDSTGTVTGVLPKNKKIMFFGDSITEGIRVLSMNADSDGNSATGAFPYIASTNLNAISYRVGFGGAGVTKSGNGGVPSLINFIDNMTKNKLAPYYEPDIIVVNIGTNDIDAATDVFKSQYTAVINRLLIKYSGTPLFIMVPFNGARKSEITDITNNKKGVYMVDTNGWDISTTDGLHPDVAGSIIAGTKLSDYMISTLGKNYFI